jgi:hypothetical protein
MLEKLATHDVQDVSALFSLAYKCAKAMEGHTWHSLATQAAKGEGKPSVGAQAQGGGNGNKKNKKKGRRARQGPARQRNKYGSIQVATVPATSGGERFLREGIFLSFAFSSQR